MAQRWRAGRPDTNTDGDTVGSANNTPADCAVPAVAVVRMAADRNDTMIDELLSKQLSIARRSKWFA